MTSATTLSAAILALPSISDERFFEATELLSIRFDRRSDLGDVRSDPEAPQLLFDWFGHAKSRVPDMQVWRTLCLIDNFFDPIMGLYLPPEWQWNTRDRILKLSEDLRASSQWVPVFESAIVSPDSVSVAALACCGADLIGVDPYPSLMTYLTEHVDSGFIWHLINPFITASRLSTYLALARRTLLQDFTRTPFGQPSPFNQPPFDHSSPLDQPSPSGRRPGRECNFWYVWHEVLTLLHEFPGEGVDLIESALRSSDLGVKCDAIDLLTFWWPDDAVPVDTVNLTRELATEEEHPQIRAQLERLFQRV